jgi:phage replication O-like protein O
MMAQECDPQLENGYVRIANELFEAMAATRLPGRQWQIVMTIIRMTYGYNRKVWCTSNRELCDITGMKRQHMHADVHELAEKNIITVTENGDKYGIKVGIQKNYEKWKCNLNRLLSPKTVTTVTENGDKASPKSVTHPLKTKDTNKDKGMVIPLPSQKPQIDTVPYDDIVSAWNEAVGDVLPEVNKKLLTEKRRIVIRARWFTSEKTQSATWWREFFGDTVAGSAFLMGRSPPCAGRKPFKATFDWVMKLDNFVKIVEGNYE